MKTLTYSNNMPEVFSGYDIRGIDHRESFLSFAALQKMDPTTARRVFVNWGIGNLSMAIARSQKYLEKQKTAKLKPAFLEEQVMSYEKVRLCVQVYEDEDFRKERFLRLYFLPVLEGDDDEKCGIEEIALRRIGSEDAFEKLDSRYKFIETRIDTQWMWTFKSLTGPMDRDCDNVPFLLLPENGNTSTQIERRMQERLDILFDKLCQDVLCKITLDEEWKPYEDEEKPVVLDTFDIVDKIFFTDMDYPKTGSIEFHLYNSVMAIPFTINGGELKLADTPYISPDFNVDIHVTPELIYYLVCKFIHEIAHYGPTETLSTTVWLARMPSGELVAQERI